MQAPNILENIFNRMREMPETFRGFVGSECQWSIPTFYRRIKTPELNSAAEREMIVKIARAQAVDLLELIDRQDRTSNA